MSSWAEMDFFSTDAVSGLIDVISMLNVTWHVIKTFCSCILKLSATYKRFIMNLKCIFCIYYKLILQYMFNHCYVIHIQVFLSLHIMHNLCLMHIITMYKLPKLNDFLLLALLTCALTLSKLTGDIKCLLTYLEINVGTHFGLSICAFRYSHLYTLFQTCV